MPIKIFAATLYMAFQLNAFAADNQIVHDFSFDSNGDGVVDVNDSLWNAYCDLACQIASGVVLDTRLNDEDNDGITDDKDDDDNGDGIVDTDADSDGLIDVRNAAEFNLISVSGSDIGRWANSSQSEDMSGCPRLKADTTKHRCRGAELVNDIDFDTGKTNPIAAGSTEQALIYEFSGLLDGNGHVIRNYSGSALIYYLHSAVVRNLGFAGTRTDINDVALAQAPYNTLIDGVFLTGKAGYTYSGAAYKSGGLIGNASNVMLRNVFSTAWIRGTNSNVIAASGAIQAAYLFTSNGEGHGLAASNDSHMYFDESFWVDNTHNDDPALGNAREVTLDEMSLSPRAPGFLFKRWVDQKNSAGQAYWRFSDDGLLPGLVLNGKLYRDGDGDGYLDEDDSFPRQYAAAIDADKDGLPDVWTPLCDQACRQASALLLDKLPGSAAGQVDADFDGQPEAWASNCDAACQHASGLALDAYPNDRDNDGINDLIDTDDNNDGKRDIDSNSNGLVDIRTLKEFGAMQYNTAGWGLQLSTLDSLDTSGCPPRLIDGILTNFCSGYELLADLDFDSNGDGEMDRNDFFGIWGFETGLIGGSQGPFTGVFEGNGHIIRNAYSLGGGNPFPSGFFSRTHGATIRNLALTNGYIKSNGPGRAAGFLVGEGINTRIENIFVTGRLDFDSSSDGGLVGYGDHMQFNNISLNLKVYPTSSSLVSNSYSLIVGGASQNTHVSNALMLGTTMNIQNAKEQTGDFSQSYWATELLPANHPGTPGTLAQLRCPIAANNTTCLRGTTLYEHWDKELGNDGKPLWQFAQGKLPALVLNGLVYRDDNLDFEVDPPVPSPSSSSGSSSSSSSSGSSSSGSQSSSSGSLGTTGGALNVWWLCSLLGLMVLRRKKSRDFVPLITQ